MPLGVRREIQETNTSAHFLHFTQTNILGAQQIPATAGVKQYGVSSSAIWSTAELLRKLLTGLAQPSNFILSDHLIQHFSSSGFTASQQLQ